MVTKHRATKQPTAKAAKPAARPRVVNKPRGPVQEQKPPLTGKYIVSRGKVSSKGWVVIPKEIRDEMGLKTGDEVQFMLRPPLPNMKQDRGLYSLHVTRVPENPAALLSGMFIRRPGEPLWTEELLKDRRREREMEDRKVRANGNKRRARA
jgi:AbrB family looped-hinge helix DNA binding protein